MTLIHTSLLLSHKNVNKNCTQIQILQNKIKYRIIIYLSNIDKQEILKTFKKFHVLLKQQRPTEFLYVQMLAWGASRSRLYWPPP